MDFVKLIDLIFLAIPLTCCYHNLRNIVALYRMRHAEPVAASTYAVHLIIAAAAYLFAYYYLTLYY
ncbi:MAG: hypothetical protein HUK09_03455 [Bacteroidaceae bacterium]|nr:hypothetical protein [Bacteroidaceae bacterium]